MLSESFKNYNSKFPFHHDKNFIEELDVEVKIKAEKQVKIEEEENKPHCQECKEKEIRIKKLESIINSLSDASDLSLNSTLNDNQVSSIMKHEHNT